MTTLPITEFLRASQGTATHASFSPFDKRTTYARMIDHSIPLTPFLKEYRHEEFSEFFGNKREKFIARHLPQVVDKLDPCLSNFQYAIEKITNVSKNNLVEPLNRYGIQHLVNIHFDPIETPLEGDLVVYYDSHDTPVHSGILRKAKTPNKPWTVESKWSAGFKVPYVIQHDLFLLPDYFGDTAKIYRWNHLKQPRPEAPTPSDRLLHVLKEGKFHFEQTEENLAIRQKIDDLWYPLDLARAFPEIHRTDIDFQGQCSMYALFEILPGYQANDAEGIDLYNNSKLLNQYFSPTRDPQPGDLAVYLKDRTRKHFGIYMAPDLIESKWGKGGVYRHPPFYVESSYGDTITFYRLKPGATFSRNSGDSLNIS